MRSIPFVTVDVFTDTRFSGNPLAVVPDARDLTDVEMQQIATEFGYSESTFVLPPRDEANTAEVRIFTPTMEIPFAGHPNVGTAFVLGRQGEVFGRPTGSVMRFEEKAGLVEIALTKAGETVIGATIRAPGPLVVGSAVEAAALAPCVSLQADDIATTSHRPSFVSVGLKFIIAEIASLDALGRAGPNIDAVRKLKHAFPHERSDCSTFLYTHVGEDHIRARMFAPLDNVPEDPATGSASAALGAYLAFLSKASGHRHLLIEQGVEMGRRSLIHLDIESREGVMEHVRVTGGCVEIMRGSISI